MRILDGEGPKALWEQNEEKAAQKERTLGYLLFYIAFISFFLKCTFDSTTLIARNALLNSALVGISLTCSMLKIFLQRYSPLRFANTMSICLLIGYSCLISINYLFLFGFLLIIAMQGMELISIIKVSFWAKVTSITMHVMIYIGVYLTNPSAIYLSTRGWGDATLRHYFFLGHPNTFSAYLVWACLDFVFINYDRLNIIHISLIWLINLLFFMFTDSRSGIIVLIIVTVLIIIDKLGKGHFDKMLTILAKYLYTVFAIFFSVMAAVYTSLEGTMKSVWHALDDFFTGRIWLGTYTYHALGLTILGGPDIATSKVYWSGRWFDTATVFDNYYLANLVSYGIIITVITALVFIAFGGKMEKREKIIIIAFSIYGIMEAYVSNVVICFALLIIGKYLYLEKNKTGGEAPEPKWLWKRNLPLQEGREKL